MTILKLISDRYERQARLFPALILIAPIVATAAAITGVHVSFMKAAAAVGVVCGGCYLLAQLARDAGKKREPYLWRSWGGVPSVAIFRHANSRLDPITKARYHKKMSSLVKEAKAPKPEQEKADPALADKVYAAWSTYVRVNTRDKERYDLLFKENVSYGFRRNLWGLRPFGIAVNVVCTCALGWRLWSVHCETGTLAEAAVGALILCGISLGLWILWFTSEWVRIPADAYAERLAEAIESLAHEK